MERASSLRAALGIITAAFDFLHKTVVSGTFPHSSPVGAHSGSNGGVMGEQEADALRYKAFLSYSHHDAAAAGRLHRRLESYRLPKRLAGTTTHLGTVPDRLWPIFRDREELAAASDLSQTVRTALSESAALIILCSPQAAESLWVAEEIRTFRELHPDRPVLAAILAGDPPHCFPEALRSRGPDGKWHEPLATDLRPGGDGPHLGLLKLVAGITGTGLDDLVQRDAHRRIRRVTAVTVAAVVLMLLTTALALFALDARSEAERQRAEAERQRAAAEGQIEFMLTDLRSRLRSVGRLDVMRAVNEKALGYYGGQRDLDRLSADSLLRRARILHAMGEDSITQGDMDAALLAFQEAHRTTAEQVQRSPDDLRRLLEHARSEYWIGRVAELRRDWAAAQRRYANFATATKRLTEAAPSNAEYLSVAAWSAVDLGNVQLNGLRDYAAAERAYRDAVTLFGRAARARPGDHRILRDQANAYGWLADSFFMRSQWRPSLDARLAQLRIVDQLHRSNPRSIEIGYRYALAQRAVAATTRRATRPADGRSHIFSAYEWSQRLVRHDPANAEWRLFKGYVGCDLALGGYGLPPGVTHSSLRSDFLADATRLARENNPRVSELCSCLVAMGRGGVANCEEGDRS